MSRNDVFYTLVIFITGVIICSIVADFNVDIRQQPRPNREKPWLPKTYLDVSNMNKCFNNCYKTYEKHEKEKQNCYGKCFELKRCVDFCEKFFKSNKVKVDSCKKECR
ncbi:hypothetical protein PIB30_020537 [Stylosanthes scabra]|uniref:Uncharacterized protein n=1 Tax=Stylosanthes scabra TaxID=79078 RepID=A0ABU6Z8V5_9FABA|nr:hypothetical protein [Stylosanthes scabra]